MLRDLTGIDPVTIPMNDADEYSLFTSLEALKCSSNDLKENLGVRGIPGFDNVFTRTLIKELKPKTFISGLSLSNGAWKDNAQELFKNKVCNVGEMISCREDIMLYLKKHGVENAIAYKIMESVRKGNKIPLEYIDTCIAHKILAYYMESMNKCKYLYSKGDATKKVRQALQIAWYKIHYPLAYYATFFSIHYKEFDIFTIIKGKKAFIKQIEEIRFIKAKKVQSSKEDEKEKTFLVALEMMERGYKIGLIDLYKSDAIDFKINQEKKELIPPLIVIDVFNLQMANRVIKARKHIFISQEDFISRTKLISNCIENLKKLHAIDDLDL